MTVTGYYVTLRRNTQTGTKTAWLLGPFEHHDDAKGWVKNAKERAEEIDPRCFWDAHGTTSISRENATLADLPKGKLNRYFGLPA